MDNVVILRHACGSKQRLLEPLSVASRMVTIEANGFLYFGADSNLVPTGCLSAKTLLKLSATAHSLFSLLTTVRNSNYSTNIKN